MYPMFRIVAGIMLLIFGRRLFWLFVGLLGFFGGFTLATRWFSGQPQWVTLLIAVLCGLIGIAIAVFLQRIAIAVAGFLAGGMFAANLLEITGWHIAPSIAFVICGIIGAILFSILFEWALIFFSSLTGALLITRVLHLEAIVEAGLAVLLLIVGIIVQTRMRPGRAVTETT